MYKVTGKSLSVIFPIWLERILISLSYRSAFAALTTYSLGSYVEWISTNPILRNKTIITPVLPESTPPPLFLENIKKLSSQVTSNGFDKFNLIYVGRLHKEKLVDQLLQMMALLKKDKIPTTLTIIGDGPEKPVLEQLAVELGVRESINFLGYVSNGDLPKYLMQANVFVSPLTGCSLREAALCGLPIVAYNMDWLSNILKNEETFLSVPENDYPAMAKAVKRLSEDKALLNRLSNNIKTFAWNTWSPSGIRASLEQVFERQN
jgi:glycosyltransferase involved in cell wall biosynthesis